MWKRKPLTLKRSRYEFYFDVVLRGQYMFHTRDLHARYGPIIRINPYELHIIDPTFYDTLFASSASGARRDKWEWYAKQFGIPGATFSTVAHDQHKVRRAALNNFFSMASVRRLQPLLDERVAKLLERFRGFKDVKGSDGMIKLDYAYAAFTNGEFCSFQKRLLVLADCKESRLLLNMSAARCTQKYQRVLARSLLCIICS